MSSDDSDQVLLVLEDGELTCQKSLLSASSPYFVAMFTKGFVETEKQVVSLHGIHLETMKILISHSQGKTVTDYLTESNLFSVLQASGMLHFEHVRRISCDYVKSILGPDNCLQLLCDADLLGETELQKLALKMVLWNFGNAVVAASSLVDVPLYILKSILDHPHVNVESETVIFDVLKRWVEENVNERVRFLPSLLACLKFDFLSATQINSILEDKIITYSPESKEFIRGQLEKHEENATKDEVRKSVCLQRRQPPVFPCVVGRLKPQTAVKLKEEDLLPHLFIFKDGNVEPYLAISKMVNSSVKAQGYRVSCIDTAIFISGGEFNLGRSNWNRTVWSYDTLFAKWKFVTAMDVYRRHHSVCVAKDRGGDDDDDVKEEGEKEEETCMYLIGGYGKHRIILDSVDKLNLGSLVLSECPPLPVMLHSPAVCYYRRRLFVIKRTVHVFDSRLNEWSSLKNVDLPTHMEFNCAFVFDGYIYLTGNHCYELYRFDPDETLEEKTMLELVGRFTNETQNICLVGNVVYNFSTDQFDYKSAIETYDLDTKTFSVVWEKDTDDFDFSPYYSSGCFPIVLY